MIKEEFLEVLKKYTSQEEQQQNMWKEVEQHYAKDDRHYHTLHHLNAMLAELQPHKDTFSSFALVGVPSPLLVFFTNKDRNI